MAGFFVSTQRVLHQPVCPGGAIFEQRFEAKVMIYSGVVFSCPTELYILRMLNMEKDKPNHLA